MTSELTTPDGRYLVIRARLWRAGDPSLSTQDKVRYLRDLLNARRALKAAKSAGGEDAIAAARKRVAQARAGLGERGKVWWTDGAPDYHRMQVRLSPYADWFARVESGRPAGHAA